LGIICAPDCSQFVALHLKHRSQVCLVVCRQESVSLRQIEYRCRLSIRGHAFPCDDA
jgi:hypothetical protein